MRIEIRRWRMAGNASDDKGIGVGYDILVPIEDVPRGNSSNIETISNGRRYMQYADATWITDLPMGYARYNAWLDHERNAQKRMLNLLHEHCPETRELTEWPVLWAYIKPKDAHDLHTVHARVADPREVGAKDRSAA